jgi:hypothetical protein
MHYSVHILVINCNRNKYKVLDFVKFTVDGSSSVDEERNRGDFFGTSF